MYLSYSPSIISPNSYLSSFGMFPYSGNLSCGWGIKQLPYHVFRHMLNCLFLQQRILQNILAPPIRLFQNSVQFPSQETGSMESLSHGSIEYPIQTFLSVSVHANYSDNSRSLPPISPDDGQYDGAKQGFMTSVSPKNLSNRYCEHKVHVIPQIISPKVCHH